MKNKKSIIIIGIECIILIALYIFANSKYIEILPQCWIYQKTGIQCLACGGTRCVVNIVKGNWIEAFFSHSIFFIAIMYLLIVNVIYLINLNKEKKIAIWIYPNYWHVTIFIVLLIIYAIVRNLL